MKKRLLVPVAIISFAVPAALAGCGGSEPEPQTPPTQASYPYPQSTAQYPQQQYPQQQYPQQQYPQQQYPQQQYPQPSASYPQGAQTPPTGSMSEPAPYSFPCQSDAQCLAHRCNVAAGKCAWPCQSNADCQAGFQCMAPACIPGGPATTTPAQ